jgi:hypothetical protein
MNVTFRGSQELASHVSQVSVSPINSTVTQRRMAYSLHFLFKVSRRRNVGSNGLCRSYFCAAAAAGSWKLLEFGRTVLWCDNFTTGWYRFVPAFGVLCCTEVLWFLTLITQPATLTHSNLHSHYHRFEMKLSGSCVS